MYRLYRCEENVSSRMIAVYATLGEAYAQAQRRAADNRLPSVRYRILGYLPWLKPARPAKPGQYEHHTHRRWFVLDDDLPMPHRGLLRASAVLTVQAEIDSRRKGSTVSPRQPGERELAAEETEAFWINCLDDGGWYVVRDGFTTHDEANEFLAWWKAENPDPFARYEIHSITKAARLAQQQAKQAQTELIARLLDKPTDEQESPATQHPAISRLIWSEDYESPTGRFERGLGASVQWGKGRRNRKGSYIP